MKRLDFPPELSVIAKSIPASSLDILDKVIEESFSSKPPVSLKEWDELLNKVLKLNDNLPEYFLAMKIKLAWIFADISFFQNNTFITNNSRYPLVLFYFGMGLVEFHNIEQGFKLIKEGMEILRNTERWYELLEISTAYSIVLNNYGRKKEFKSFLAFIKVVFEEKCGCDPGYQYLLVVAQLFDSLYEGRRLKDYHSDALDVAEQSGDRLIIALTHSFLADKDDEEKYIKSMKLSIEILESINARFREIMAYVNLAAYCASKTKYDDFNINIRKAVELANGISQSTPNIGHIYPFLQESWVMIKRGQLRDAEDILAKVIKLAEDFSRPNYLVKSYTALAYVNYLLNNNDFAFKYTSIALDIASADKNSDLYKSFLLEHIDLLIELKMTEDVKSYLSEVMTFLEDLDPCYKAFYDYTRAKFELSNHNIGFAKEILYRVSQQENICSRLKPLIFLELGECYLSEFRLSDNPILLEKAQQIIKKGMSEIVDIPERIKAEYLSAILLVAQKKYNEAEMLLGQLISKTAKTVPRFNTLATQLLDDLRNVKNSEFGVSSLSNIKDVINYLKDAKSLTHTEPR